MTIDTISPSTGEKLKSYPEMSEAQVNDMIVKTHEVFLSWRKVSFAERSQRLKEVARILRQRKKSDAELIAQEMGKPLAQGEAEIEKCAWVADYYAEHGENFLKTEEIKTDASKSFIVFEPIGILLAVMPWNFPYWQVFRAAVPAIMAGNGFILKHASNVTGCALAIEEIFRATGFPDHLFRTVVIKTELVSKMIEHPLIQAVTLTGGTPAGKAVAKKAGEMLKKTVLELGGSDPYIVLEDADLERAVEACVTSRLINSGQSCIAAKRFIVQKSVKEKFERLFVAQMEKQKMGDPFENGVTLGPLARYDLRDGLHELVEQSINSGAKLLTGGKKPESNGAFYPPTVLSDVKKGMRAYSEETFGPVASIISVEDEREAVRVANDTIFGLGAAIFTKDIKKAERMVSELEAGSCFVNSFVKSDPRLPFGGIKQSGYGRELSSFGIREFVNIKTVYIK